MLLIAWVLIAFLSPAGPEAELRGRVVDFDTGALLPCRITILGKDGIYYFARSAVPEGSAIEYRKSTPQHPPSAENHVTLSAHPFQANIPPGSYTLSVEHGKEYLPDIREVQIGASGLEVTIRLKRWIDLARLGWYSGETHVHRMPDELPNLMLAEDLNVAFPLTAWVTEAYVSPAAANRARIPGGVASEVRKIDATHVYYPRNTEYEIFRVGSRNHTLGALFILNHKTAFESGLPPVGPIVDQARREGALLDLDKHNWPWSMMLAPAFQVDLYELANNHMWETEFAFRDFGAAPPDYMQITKDARGYSELGWIDYTFQNYYALLDCGLRMRPTAGCASGVHPVPLGFGRVYVHLDGPFTYEAWVEGLRRGQSFVTTGPMLFVDYSAPDDLLTVRTRSGVPISKVDIIINGEVAASLRPDAIEEGRGFSSTVLAKPGVTESSWIAVRCFEDRPDRKIRFAHSSPLYLDVPGKPLRPRRVEAAFLLGRIDEALAREGGLLSPESLAEYQKARNFYRDRLKEAR